MSGSARNRAVGTEDEALAALARRLGLEQAYAIDPAAFARAHRAARDLVERCPEPGTLDEPAHVFRPPDAGENRR